MAVELVIPYEFANRTSPINLSELDANFTYLKNNIGLAAAPAVEFDGGSPSSNFVAGPSIDCGGVN